MVKWSHFKHHLPKISIASQKCKLQFSVRNFFISTYRPNGDILYIEQVWCFCSQQPTRPVIRQFFSAFPRERPTPSLLNFPLSSCEHPAHSDTYAGICRYHHSWRYICGYLQISEFFPDRCRSVWCDSLLAAHQRNGSALKSPTAWDFPRGSWPKFAAESRGWNSKLAAVTIGRHSVGHMVWRPLYRVWIAIVWLLLLLQWCESLRQLLGGFIWWSNFQVLLREKPSFRVVTAYKVLVTSTECMVNKGVLLLSYTIPLAESKGWRHEILSHDYKRENTYQPVSRYIKSHYLMYIKYIKYDKGLHYLVLYFNHTDSQS